MNPSKGFLVTGTPAPPFDAVRTFWFREVTFNPPRLALGASYRQQYPRILLPSLDLICRGRKSMKHDNRAEGCKIRNPPRQLTRTLIPNREY
jgi:hypothetical protein